MAVINLITGNICGCNEATLTSDVFRQDNVELFLDLVEQRVQPSLDGRVAAFHA